MRRPIRNILWRAFFQGDFMEAWRTMRAHKPLIAAWKEAPGFTYYAPAYGDREATASLTEAELAYLHHVTGNSDA